MDTVWSFGMWSAVQAAQRTSWAVNWVFKKETLYGRIPLIREHLFIPGSYTDNQIMDWIEQEELWNYIDDFIGVTPDFLGLKLKL